MSVPLSQKQIGNRLALIRQFKGLSQEELANKIAISSSSLTAIELGGRNLSALELRQIALILSFSIDYFLSDQFDIKQLQEEKSTITDQLEERNPKPTLNPSKLKEVFLYLLEHLAGKPNIDELALQKMLYFCDFNYYELYEEHLTGLNYNKLSQGPVGIGLAHFIQQLLSENLIQRIESKDTHALIRYLPLIKADLRQLKASEKATMDRVIEQFSNWSSASITSYCEKDLPLLTTKVGEKINYELVFYRELPYTVRNYELEIAEV